MVPAFYRKLCGVFVRFSLRPSAGAGGYLNAAWSFRGLQPLTAFEGALHLHPPPSTASSPANGVHYYYCQNWLNGCLYSSGTLAYHDGVLPKASASPPLTTARRAARDQLRL
jgi:hypothetical protein